MRKLLSFGTLGLAGAVGVGLMALPGATVAASFDEGAAVKREDGVTELVLVDDDDDDDTADDSVDSADSVASADTFTGFSRSTNDRTRSNFTKVSRDRDISRSDKTRDWTRDGKNDRKKRDWTADSTNDRSRNDTR